MAEFIQKGGSNGGSYASYFTCKLTVWEISYDIASNSSSVGYRLELISGSSGRFSGLKASFKVCLDSQGSPQYKEGSGTYSSQSYNTAQTICEGTRTIYHNADGSKNIGCWASLDFESNTYSPGDFSPNGYMNLTTIPRYTTVWNSERGKTINTISINWSTSDARDWTQYSLNGGAWTDAYDSVSEDQKSGYYTISGLNPNTKYIIKTRCRRRSSGLWSEADNLEITTYDIAKINSIPGFNLGDNETIGYSNPSGSSIRISIHNTEGSVVYCGYRQCTGSSYTFDFTQEELDRLYKLFKSNTVTVRVYLVTNCNGVDYYNYHNVTITLKGNQKTVKVNNDSIWKRGKIWTNIEGMWKRAIIWTNVDGTWKKSI